MAATPWETVGRTMGELLTLELEAKAAQLAINLEPIYAIVLAALLLGEQRELSMQFYLGVAIIIAAVSLQPFVGRPPLTWRTYTRVWSGLPPA